MELCDLSSMEVVTCIVNPIVSLIKFALEDPHDSTKILGSIDIQRGALAASSILKRSWETSKGKQHHIIDPKTRNRRTVLLLRVL